MSAKRFLLYAAVTVIYIAFVWVWIECLYTMGGG
jgi:hypothetical protein